MVTAGKPETGLLQTGQGRNSSESCPCFAIISNLQHKRDVMPRGPLPAESIAGAGFHPAAAAKWTVFLKKCQTALHSATPEQE
jgi:hypothetical protein